MKKNKSLKNFYNKTFQKKDRIRDTEEFSEVLNMIDWKGKNIIDVGCGTGKLAYLISKRGANVLGIDYSSRAIEIAKKKFKNRNLSYRQLDAAREIPGKYDVIVSIGTLEHMDNPYIILKKFKKHLNKNGIIIITSPNWSNPRGYILMTLYYLFKAPITLADLHYLTPIDFIFWAKKLKMNLIWKTFEKSWSHGGILIQDFKNRLPKVLSDIDLYTNKIEINNFLKWLTEKVLPLNNSLPHSGAIGLYIFYKNTKPKIRTKQQKKLTHFTISKLDKYLDKIQEIKAYE